MRVVLRCVMCCAAEFNCVSIVSYKHTDGAFVNIGGIAPTGMCAMRAPNRNLWIGKTCLYKCQYCLERDEKKTGLMKS